MKVKDIKVGTKVKLNALGIQHLGPNRAEMLKGTLIVTEVVKVKTSPYDPDPKCHHYAEIEGDDGGVWLIYIDPVKVKHYRRAKDYLDETVPNRKSACKNIFVPKDVCYIDFRSRKAKGQIKTAKQMGNTIRGEMVVVDYDKKGRMVGIELLSNDKPCQKPPKKGTSIVTVFGDKTKVKIPKEVTGPIMCITMRKNKKIY